MAFILRSHFVVFVLCPSLLFTAAAAAINKVSGGCDLSNARHAWKPITYLPRNVVSDDDFKWPNGEVPYIIDGSISDTGIITQAMNHIESLSCIKFIEYDESVHSDYIEIVDFNEGCWADIGRLQGPQFVVLQQNSCMDFGTTIHELMHALGFYHEHQRYDQETYVTVMWENIWPEKQINFDALGPDLASTLGLAYDYDSIMHYGVYEHAIDDTQPTLVPTDSSVEIGQRNGLSDLDRKKLNTWYGC